MRWSSNLAYVIGLIVTDGNLSKDGRHMELTSKDIAQIELFAKILKLQNKISPKYGSDKTAKPCYHIQFGNVKFYRFLQSLGLIPNKTKTIAEIKIPDKYFADFLRGHFDGDGCTTSYWDKRWKSSFLLYTSFLSASQIHLVWLHSQIVRLYGLNGKIRYNGKSTYILQYAKKNSIILLSKMYYKENIACLQRKRSKINDSLAIIMR